MIKIALLIIAVSLVASQAIAGTLTWTIETASGTISWSAEVSDADIDRVATAHRIKLGLPENATLTEVQRRIAKDFMNNLVRDTAIIERQEFVRIANEEAIQNIQPIVATPITPDP